MHVCLCRALKVAKLNSWVYAKTTSSSCEDEGKKLLSNISCWYYQTSQIQICPTLTDNHGLICTITFMTHDQQLNVYTFMNDCPSKDCTGTFKAKQGLGWYSSRYCSRILLSIGAVRHVHLDVRSILDVKVLHPTSDVLGSLFDVVGSTSGLASSSGGGKRLFL